MRAVLGNQHLAIWQFHVATFVMGTRARVMLCSHVQLTINEQAGGYIRAKYPLLPWAMGFVSKFNRTPIANAARTPARAPGLGLIGADAAGSTCKRLYATQCNKCCNNTPL